MVHKRLLVAFLITAFVLGACSFNVNIKMDEGSGKVVSEARSVSGFDRVQLNAMGEIVLVQGEQESLTIEAEDNILREITTEVRDGILHIGFNKKVIMPTKTIKYYLTMREIRGLETRGASNIQAEGIDTDLLEIGISGAGNVNIAQLNAERLTVHISGTGNLNLAGTVIDQKINLSGAGNYNGEDLSSQRAAVNITGLGKVTVWVQDKLDVSISGAGGIDYFGSPQVSQQISGLGNIKKLGNK
jgi:hypothetical protein